MCSGMLKTKAIMTYFGHNSFYFSFISVTQEKMYSGGEEVTDREVVDRELAEQAEKREG